MRNIVSTEWPPILREVPTQVSLFQCLFMYFQPWHLALLNASSWSMLFTSCSHVYLHFSYPCRMLIFFNVS